MFSSPVTFAVTLTAVLRNLGLNGKLATMASSFILGGFATFMITNHPDLWDALSAYIIGLEGTGAVAFAYGLLDKFKR